MATRYEHAKPSRNDPFYEPPLHKAFYYPTRQQDLQDDKKWVALAPGRGKEPPDDRDIHFLQPTNTYTSQATATGASPGDTSSKFDESWPASERPSTLDALQDESGTSVPPHEDSGGPMKPLSALLREYGVPQSSNNRPLVSDFMSEISKVGDTSALSQTTCSTEPATRASTLSKYIQRFRHGEPLSREQRAQREATTNPADFWWLRSDSPQGSSTPRNMSDASQAKVTSRLQGHSGLRFTSASELARTRGTSDLDSETLRLQEKTERLLERSESSLDSSAPVVSTVGLGSDTSSSSTTIPQGTGPHEKSYLPSFLATGQSIAPAGGEARKPLRPEDDILYQWRQQRRMEALRNKASRFLVSSQGTTSAEQVADEVESKLAEFRRKVSTGPRERLPPPNIHHDKARSVPGDTCSKTADVNTQNTDHVKVDAVCQTRTNTDAECQTSLNADQEPTSTHAPITSTQHRSPIASPSMARRKLTNHPVESTEMEPHFHLSCDILPCPHEHHHRTPENRKHLSKSKGSPERRKKHKSYLSDTDTDESRPMSQRNISEEEPVKDVGPLVIDSCSDVEYENYKKQHMVQLKEELESISSEDPGHTHERRSDQRSSPRKQRSREHKDQKKESRKEEKENRHGSSSETDRKHRQKRSQERDESYHSSRERSKERGRADRGRQLRESSKSDRSQSRERRERDQQRAEKPVTSTKQATGSDTKVTDRKYRPQNDHSSENREVGPDQIPEASTHKSGKSKETKLKPRVGAQSPEPRNGQPRSTKGGRNGRVSRSEVVRGSLTDASVCDVTPLCHSSPIRGQRAVTPTIQQVVTEHLFEDTEVNESQTASGQTQPEEGVVHDGSAESDGEEYTDDDLLQELRAHREQYRQRLEILDQLLTLTMES